MGGLVELIFWGALAYWVYRKVNQVKAGGGKDSPDDVLTILRDEFQPDRSNRTDHDATPVNPWQQHKQKREHTIAKRRRESTASTFERFHEPERGSHSPKPETSPYEIDVSARPESLALTETPLTDAPALKGMDMLGEKQPGRAAQSLFPITSHRDAFRYSVLIGTPRGLE